MSYRKNIITKVQHPNSKLDAQIMHMFCGNEPRKKIYKYYNDLLNAKINVAQILRSIILKMK